MLIAADAAFVRERFKKALDTAGHRPLLVRSIAQLLAHVRADFDDLDLIVLDLKMPHTSGVDLVKRIRKLDEGKLPILVLSGSVTMSIRCTSWRVVMGIPVSYRIDKTIVAARAHFFRSVKIAS